MNKMIKTLILIFLFFHTKEETIINLEDLQSGDGYTIGANKITFTSPGTYNIAGQSNLALVISNSITLNLFGVQITTEEEEELPPIDICSGCQVTFNIKVTSSFTDNASNAKNAVIYMQSGSSLTITSETTNTGLFLTPVKDKGIYGEGSNNLIVNNGVTIQYDDNNYATFIEIDGNIEVNHGNIGFKNNVQNASPPIKASGSITIKTGMCGLHSIQAENNIKIGERGVGSYSNTNVQIRTRDEGMKAKDIEIYSSQLNIFSDKDSISSTGNILIEDSFVYLYAGSTGLSSSPFKKVGKLQIRNTNIIAFGTNCEGEIMTNQGTMTFVGDIIPGKEIYIAQYGVASEGINPDKEYRYYFRTSPGFQPSVNDDIQLLIDGVLVPSEEHSCNVISDDGSNAGNSGNTGNAGKKKKNSAKYLNVLKLYHLLFIYLILF